MILGPIVEGFGDQRPVPILVRRIAALLDPERVVKILPPHRCAKHKLLKAGELERVVELVARQTGRGGRILIVVDADDHCPAQLGPDLLVRARAARADRETAVVVANREFEAWYLAAIGSLAGCRSLPSRIDEPAEPERIRGAKKWLAERMGVHGYSETLDQAAFAAQMDLTMARRADSFDKLVRDLERLFTAPVLAG